MGAIAPWVFAVVSLLFLVLVLLLAARCGMSYPMYLPEFKVVSFSVICYLEGPWN